MAFIISTTVTNVVARGLGADTIERRSAFILAFNQFPGYYIPWSTHAINEVQYGYNISYCLEKQKLNFRIGFNFNRYKRQSTIRITDSDLGFEGGVEVRILAKRRKWIVNMGLLMYKGWSWSCQYYSPQLTEKYLLDELGIGPIVVIGRKVKDRWVITTEYSVSIGAAFYERNNIRYDQKVPAVRNWKWFGIGFRHYLK